MMIINPSLCKCMITDLLYVGRKLYVTDSFTGLVFFCDCCIRLTMLNYNEGCVCLFINIV
jgi:hypothetical protein